MTTFVISDAARTAACDAIVDLLDVGAGTQADCVIATAGSTTDLVTIGLGSPAFGAAATGVASIAATVTGTAAATGTAAKFRLQDQDNTLVASGDVGTSGATMTITNTSINTSDVVQLTAMSVTVPDA